MAHDELAPAPILAMASPTAELLPVGRRHGAGPASYRLHPAVIERALEGKRVVKLKAGDPFAFGRGDEEIEELAGFGIFEVVPGVTAALGAAVAAAIPLTHRDFASDVTLATGPRRGWEPREPHRLETARGLDGNARPLHGRHEARRELATAHRRRSLAGHSRGMGLIGHQTRVG